MHTKKTTGNKMHKNKKQALEKAGFAVGSAEEFLELTPEQTMIVNKNLVIIKLVKALEEARDHLDYCGYGDAWERQVRPTLEQQINEALKYAAERPYEDS